MASPLELSSVFSKKFLSTVNITNYPDLANFLVLTKKFVKSVVYCSTIELLPENVVKIELFYRHKSCFIMYPTINCEGCVKDCIQLWKSQ